MSVVGGREVRRTSGYDPSCSENPKGEGNTRRLFLLLGVSDERSKDRERRGPRPEGTANESTRLRPTFAAAKDKAQGAAALRREEGWKTDRQMRTETKVCGTWLWKHHLLEKQQEAAQLSETLLSNEVPPF